MELFTGDCLAVMPTLEANSVDTIITDPPYALTNRVADVQCCLDCGRVMGGRDGNGTVKTCPKCGSENVGSRRNYVGAGFMGKDWDTGLVAFSPEVWAEALRVAKPGATLLAFGGDRTHHRLMVAIEDAGWEIRTCIYWAFGQGFPKSMSISKALDKAAGAERTEGRRERSGGLCHNNSLGGGSGQENGTTVLVKYDTPATPAAELWDGWGTGLKPAVEIIVVAMKPLDRSPWLIELTPELLDEWEAIQYDHE